MASRHPEQESDTSGAQSVGERLVIIANPRAGGGRAGRAKAEIAAAAKRAFAHVEVRWTEAQGDGTRIAREVAPHCDIVAALGGDGTCNEVVNGLVVDDRLVNPRVIFTTIPFGTGGDLVRSLEIPRKIADALWVAATGTTVHCDVGRMEWASGAVRYFINVAGVGANAEVCERVNRSGKPLGGTITFLGAILATVATFKPRPSVWRWSGPEGKGEIEQNLLAGFVANAHYCGAGLWVGKGGSMADGAFDVTLLGPLGVGQALMSLPHTRSGRLEKIPGAIRFRAHDVELSSGIPLETDGEPQAPGPVRFTVLPRILQVRGAWKAPPGPL